MKFLFLIFALAGLFAGCKSPPPERPGKRVLSPPPLAVESFEAAWRIINETHFDTNFNGVDWVAARTNFLPRVEKASNDEEVRDIIQEMLDLLGHSHLTIIEGTGPKTTTNTTQAVSIDLRSAPADAGRAPKSQGAPPFDFRALDNKIVVTRVEPDSAAERLGLKPGMIIQSIDDAPAVDESTVEVEATREHRAFLQWHFARDLLGGGIDEPALLEVETEQGAKTFTIPRLPAQGTLSQLGNLPPMRTRVETRTITSAGGKRVGYVWFNYWLLPLAGAFDRFIDEHRNADGIVIDLRGNVGGIGAMASGLAGHMVNQRTTLGVMKFRDNELNFPVFPRRVDTKANPTNTFQGPIAILTDPITLSTSELFAGGMQEMGRARVFGENSGGQALPAVAEVLPNGDLLYHAIADFQTPQGRRLEENGVKPDEEVPLRLEALRERRDEPLEAALRWIDSAPQSGGSRLN